MRKTLLKKWLAAMVPYMIRVVVTNHGQVEEQQTSTPLVIRTGVHPVDMAESQPKSSRRRNKL